MADHLPIPLDLSSSEPKRFFIPLQVKITLLSSLLVFVSMCVVGTVSYRRILRSNIEPLLGKRLDYSARGIAVTVPGEKYQKLVTTYLNHPDQLDSLPEAKEIRQFLLISQRQNELTADVQTLIKSPSHPDRMIALMTSNEAEGVKELPLDALVSQVFNEGLPLFSPIYPKGGGIWVSGLAPIETAKGDIIGVVRVDYEASQEVATVQKDVLKTLATAGSVGFILALIMGIFLGRALSRPVKELSSAAKEVMNGNLNPRIQVTTSDEIGILANIFKKMIIEIRNSRQSLEDYSKNLETKVRDRTMELKEANQKTEAMLDSLGQGFFLFQSDGMCLPIHSNACLQVLEGSPEGKKLGDYLRSDLDGGIYEWVKALFSELLPFESIAPLGVKVFPHSQGSRVELDYHPIRDDEGSVKLVVAVATDRTAELQARETAALERARSRRILLIMENKDQFLSFIREMNQIIHEVEILKDKHSSDLVSELTRGLHTIKGGAALFQFQGLRDLAHQMEAEISPLISKSDLDANDWLILNSIIINIRKELNEALIELRPILGDTLVTGVKSYSHLESTLIEFLKQARAAGIQREVIEKWEKSLLHEPVIQGFSHFNEVVVQAAQQLGKRILPIVFEGGEVKVYLRAYERLLSSLVHAFRNAVDHGIESAEKRLEQGKPEAGEIRVAFQVVPEASSKKALLKIQIKDDGGGINAEKIREKLKKINPHHVLLKAEDSEIYQVLFESGLSTKTEVTELSGRGVGLDAILFEAKRLKGNARLESELGRGTLLTVEIPLLSAVSLGSEDL